MSKQPRFYADASQSREEYYIRDTTRGHNFALAMFVDGSAAEHVARLLNEKPISVGDKSACGAVREFR